MKWAAGLLSAAMAVLGGCQTSAEMTPAVLVSDDEASMQALKTALGEAVGRANVELGAGDPTKVSRVSVLPPPLGPLETRSVAKPAWFQIMMAGGDCMVMDVESGETHALKGGPCQPTAE